MTPEQLNAIKARMGKALAEDWTATVFIRNEHGLAVLQNAFTDIQLLVEEVSSLTDRLDLALDEFQRIQSLGAELDSDYYRDEIRGLCERARANIRQNVPVIVQRDEALKTCAKLADENATLHSSLRAKDEALKQAEGVLTEPGIMDVDEWKAWQKRTVVQIRAALKK